VHEAVDDRAKQNGRHGDQRQSRIQRVKAREEFSALAQVCFDGPHASEDHRGVEERVAPPHLLKVHVAGHASEQGRRD
jgi:hypothetical protein